ncbi:MAG: hypothetical protein ACXVP5_02480 [Tumebacillaceae bacterium]
MQQQMHQLETEIARLQIELRQVRQLIGSLIRSDQTAHHMMRSQQSMGTPSMQQLNPQYLQEEMQAPQQYNSMRQLADRMDGQLRQISQAFTPQSTHTPFRYNAMTPATNDPMQQQY